MQASKWLYTAPVQPDSLAWSQDDLLAVAAGPAVVLVNPFDMQGPRSYINFSARGDATASHPQCTPEEPDSSLKYALSCMRTERVKEFSWAPHVKSIAWSPPGCGPDGICLLATVLSDHQVGVKPVLNPQVDHCVEIVVKSMCILLVDLILVCVWLTWVCC